MFFDEGNVTEVVTTTAAEHDPQDTANHVIANELLVVHARARSDEGHKGPDDWHEARDRDCDATVFLEKAFRLSKLFLIDQFAEPRRFSQPLPQGVTNVEV